MDAKIEGMELSVDQKSKVVEIQIPLTKTLIVYQQAQIYIQDKKIKINTNAWKQIRAADLQVAKYYCTLVWNNSWDVLKSER